LGTPRNQRNPQVELHSTKIVLEQDVEDTAELQNVVSTPPLENNVVASTSQSAASPHSEELEGLETQNVVKDTAEVQNVMSIPPISTI
jgi:hypothetical protein